jgi:hypothetical protein
MKGDVVTAPTGEQVVLVDIGLVELVDNEFVRVWDVSLDAGAVHSWHLHHNPYLVLSVNGSDGRMDWLDGSPPRFISEYRGGAVYRPTSPVHRLTNVGDRFYRNRLVELKHLGEHLPEPFDIGPGARSVEGEPSGDPLPDGREPVIQHPHVTVWTLTLAPGESRAMYLSEVPHVVASLDAQVAHDDPAGGVTFHDGGALILANELAQPQGWFVVELGYLARLSEILDGESA